MTMSTTNDNEDDTEAEKESVRIDPMPLSYPEEYVKDVLENGEKLVFDSHRQAWLQSDQHVLLDDMI